MPRAGLEGDGAIQRTVERGARDPKRIAEATGYDVLTVKRRMRAMGLTPSPSRTMRDDPHYDPVFEVRKVA